MSYVGFVRCVCLVAMVAVVAAACGSEGLPEPGQMVFSARPAEQGAYGWQLFVADRDGTNLERLTTVDGDASPEWSPDGTRVAFEREESSESGIWVAELTGWNTRRLADGALPTWSPDGSRIAFTRQLGDPPSYEVAVIDPDGGNERTLAKDAGWPKWSPDGEQILFQQLTDENEGHLAVMRDDGSDVKALTSTRGDSCAEWSPDGEKIAFCRGPNGGELYVMDSDGSDVTRITDTGNTESHFITPYPVWSPDGRRILYMKIADHGEAIAVVDADGGNERVLSPTPGPDEFVAYGYPVWSPDGKQIAFANEDEIWVMNAYGTERHRLVKGPFTEPDLGLDWAPATKE